MGREKTLERGQQARKRGDWALEGLGGVGGLEDQAGEAVEFKLGGQLVSCHIEPAM